MSSPKTGLLSGRLGKIAAGGTVVITVGLLLAKFLWFSDDVNPVPNPDAKPDAVASESLTPTMVWQTMDGKTTEQAFSKIKIETIDPAGFWVAFETEGEQCFPGICVDGQFERLDAPLSQIGTLSLRLKLQTKTGPVVRQCQLLDRTDDIVRRAVHPSNVYHISLLMDFIDPEQAAISVDPKTLPYPEWAEPFERTRRLALNYALQSDARTREFVRTCQVTARYDQPRLIMTSEELVETEFTSTAGQKSEIAENIHMPMVLIPPGVVNIVKSSKPDQPNQLVFIERPFWLGTYEVTQAQWMAVMKKNPSRFRGATSPVDQVSWDACQEFIKLLNERVGGPRFFLPTFAQWEHARQVGGREPNPFVDGRAQLSKHAWHAENEGQKTHPVGELLPNAWGLYDMLGNVQEWTSSTDVADVAPVSKEPDSKQSFVIAGAHFYSNDVITESGVIFNFGGPSVDDFTFGFRVAREYAGESELSENLSLVSVQHVPNANPPTPGVYRIHIPVQRVDVLYDRIEAEGEYAAGFQVGRSMWNDILEGKVLYDADPLHGRVLTASAVFSQMRKNIADRQSVNRVLRVTADTSNLVEKNSQLWPAVKSQISTFLAANPDWEVLVPDRPVAFYDGEEPLYEMCAWFQVHPESGRLVGKLPNGSSGAKSDRALPTSPGFPQDQRDKAWKKAQDRLQKEFANQPGGKLLSGNPAGGYFNSLSGMFVAAAGVIDGIAVLMLNPTLADGTPAELQKFLALHALDQAAGYLEQNAAMYGSYAAQLAFWQGAVLLPAALGGKEAMIDAANRGMEFAKKKAKADAEEYVQGKLDDGKSLAKDEHDRIINDAVRDSSPAIRTMADALGMLLKNSNVEWDPQTDASIDGLGTQLRNE